MPQQSSLGVLRWGYYHLGSILVLVVYIFAILNTNILLDFFHSGAHRICSTVAPVLEYVAIELFTQARLDGLGLHLIPRPAAGTSRTASTIASTASVDSSLPTVLSLSHPLARARWIGGR
jgi:hypothetical protein